jgi:hypothetical protein
VPIDFDSYSELLDACDAVDIAATTTAHYELAKQALTAGKHVFFGETHHQQAGRSLRASGYAEKNKLKIQVVHIERINPVIKKEEHEISEPMFIRVPPASPPFTNAAQMSRWYWM